MSDPVPISPHHPDAERLYQARHGDFQRCLHCQSCANGCPFIAAMDYHPNAVIRLVQFGLMERALNCATIWTCVACNTCSVQCPMAIDIAALMDALRQMALAREIPPAEPDVLSFHQEVLDSVARYGRTHKLEIMLRYKLKTRQWLVDWQLGLRMLAKRKLDLAPSRVAQIDAVRALFNSNGKEPAPCSDLRK